MVNKILTECRLYKKRRFSEIFLLIFIKKDVLIIPLTSANALSDRGEAFNIKQRKDK